MLTIPTYIQNLFKTDGVRKNFRVHFPNGELPDITNDNVVQESVRFTESICSQDTFKFGLAEKSVIEFETVGIPNMYGMMIECGIEIDTSSLSAAQITAIQLNEGDGTLVLLADSDLGYGFYRVPLGVFRVESCPRNHQAMTHRAVEAYSVFLDGETLSFPSGMPFSAITSYKSVIDALSSGNLTMVGSYGFVRASQFIAKEIFNSSGEAFDLYCNANVGGTYKNQMNANLIQPISGKYPAFLKPTMPDYDPVAYEQFGVTVANAVTTAGFDLTYNSTGQKIYENNEAALRDAYPQFFSPCVMYSFLIPQKTEIATFLRGYSQNVRDGEYAPIILSTGFSANDPAFLVDKGQYDTSTNPCYFLYFYNEADVSTFRLNIQKRNGTNTTVNVSTDGVIKEEPTLEVFSVPSLTTKISFPNVGQAKVNMTYNQTPKTFKLTGYFFDTYQLVELASNSLEVSGEFLKPTRNGGEAIITFDPSDPVEITTADFHGGEMWWDEYNVSPIGSVLVTFGSDDGEATIEIPIGTGASVYDMSDNTMMQLVSLASLDDVSTLLNNLFSANAANVAFTPVELTMQGLPWIEAGDALEVTTEDMTVVNTYALRIEMTGIQHLTSVITAQGGEIIGEV